MSGPAMVMMALILTLVWGGFAAALLVAMSRERRRARGEEETNSPAPGGRPEGG